VHWDAVLKLEVKELTARVLKKSRMKEWTVNIEHERGVMKRKSGRMDDILVDMSLDELDQRAREAFERQLLKNNLFIVRGIFIIISHATSIISFYTEPGPNTQTSTRYNDDGEVLISQETGVYYLKILASFDLLCKEAELIKLRKSVTVRR
jgi:hypothetical protein